MSKELLFTVTRKDCEWQFYRPSGHGGQHRDKTSNAVRVVHKDSGAVGICSENRERSRNMQSAFKKMAESRIFQVWAKMKAQEIMGIQAEIERRVDEMMSPNNLKVEVFTNGNWVEEAS
jgi:protein subunit release factor B